MSVESDFMAGLELRTKLRSVSTQQGWTKENWFVIGRECFMPSGEIKDIPILSSSFSSRGDPAQWALSTESLHGPEAAEEAFTLLLAFASPLLKFSPTKAVFANIYGKPLSGKTVLGNLVMSVWGDPGVLMMPPGNDIVQRMDTFNRHGNLPVVMDGGSNYIGAADLIVISNDFSTGTSSVPSKPGDTASPRVCNWSSVFLMTSYDGVYNKVLRSTRPQHKHAPIFEYEIGLHDVMTKESTSILRNSQMNFGSAGRAYAYCLVTAQHTLQERVNNWIENIKRRTTIQAGYGNLISLVACVAAGAEIAAELGLIRFDPYDAVEFGVRRILQIADMLNKYHASQGVKVKKKRIRKKSPAPSPTPSFPA